MIAFIKSKEGYTMSTINISVTAYISLGDKLERVYLTMITTSLPRKRILTKMAPKLTHWKQSFSSPETVSAFTR